MLLQVCLLESGLCVMVRRLLGVASHMYLKYELCPKSLGSIFGIHTLCLLQEPPSSRHSRAPGWLPKPSLSPHLISTSSHIEGWVLSGCWLNIQPRVGVVKEVTFTRQKQRLFLEQNSNSPFTKRPQVDIPPGGAPKTPADPVPLSPSATHFSTRSLSR